MQLQTVFGSPLYYYYTRGGGLHITLSVIPRYQMMGSKSCLLSIYRLDLDPHPPVQFDGPEGPGKLHWGERVKIEPINTEQTRLGPPPSATLVLHQCNILHTSLSAILIQGDV